MRRGSIENEPGSMFDVTDTPRRDLFKYAAVYPMLVASLAVGVSFVDVVIAFLGLVGVALLSLLAAWWVTRTGEVGPVEPSFGVHHALTDDAAQRLRILLFAGGIVVWGGFAIVGVLWVDVVR